MRSKSLVILMKALPVLKALVLISYRWRERQKTPIRIFRLQTDSQRHTNSITLQDVLKQIHFLHTASRSLHPLMVSSHFRHVLRSDPDLSVFSFSHFMCCGFTRHISTTGKKTHLLLLLLHTVSCMHVNVSMLESH